MGVTTQRLPEKYYQRRRAAAAIVLIVVVGLLIWGLSAWARSNSGQDSAEEATSAATSGTTESSESKPSETETPAEEPAENPPEEPAKSCSLADLSISASLDHPDYAPGAKPTFYMKVNNPTAADCEIDLSENLLRFEVYNLRTNERIWSDADCNRPVAEGTYTFPAEEETAFQAVWSRTASAPERCEARAEVPAGSYFLHAAIGENISPAETFNLR